MDEHNTKSCRRLVVKFGGASLADEERVLKAATAIAGEVAKGAEIAVVVSALGKTTDFLLQMAREASGGKVGKEELDDILAMGERTSIRIFNAALKAKGVESRYFDPLDEDWPIITDDNFSNANPILEQCEERAQRCVLPLVEKGVVPVVAGFVGRTLDGRTTTIGRGGSDSTAFILAKALKADEVILMTDVDGIMSADPKLVSSPRKLERISVNTLVGLTDSGAKFIHGKALKYKDPSVNVRIVNYAHGDLNKSGTLILGALPTELDVEMGSQSPAMSITVVGQGISEEPAILRELVEKVKAHTRLLGLSADYNSIILYVPDCEDSGSAMEEIHETVLKHEKTIAMAVRKQLAFLTVKGVGLEETPGIIGKMSEVLRLNEINIFGILTIASSILLFADWDKRETVLNLIKNALRGN